MSDYMSTDEIFQLMRDKLTADEALKLWGHITKVMNMAKHTTWCEALDAAYKEAQNRDWVSCCDMIAALKSPYEVEE